MMIPKGLPNWHGADEHAAVDDKQITNGKDDTHAFQALVRKKMGYMSLCLIVLPVACFKHISQ